MPPKRRPHRRTGPLRGQARAPARTGRGQARAEKAPSAAEARRDLEALEKAEKAGRVMVFRNKDGEISDRGHYVYQGRGKGRVLVRARGFLQREIEEVGAPSPEKLGRASGRKGARLFTYFKAMGTFASNPDIYNADLFVEDIDEFGVPKAFFSNQSTIFGQVKFKGRVALEDLIRRLNNKVQFLGEETEGFDFREVYPIWSYKYQVVEVIGPSVRVLETVRDERGV